MQRGTKHETKKFDNEETNRRMTSETREQRMNLECGSNFRSKGTRRGWGWATDQQMLIEAITILMN